MSLDLLARIHLQCRTTRKPHLILLPFLTATAAAAASSSYALPLQCNITLSLSHSSSYLIPPAISVFSCLTLLLPPSLYTLPFSHLQEKTDTRYTLRHLHNFKTTYSKKKKKSKINTTRERPNLTAPQKKNL